MFLLTSGLEYLYPKSKKIEIIQTKEDDYNMLTWKNTFPTKYGKISNGETISYRETGKSKIPVIMIHGTETCSLNWEKLMVELSPDYRCVAIC